MLKYFLIIVVCYLLVRFIFGFVIPVVSATLKMKRKMREMQDHVNQYQTNQNTNANNNNSSSQTTPKASSSDYIEFEEIK